MIQQQFETQEAMFAFVADKVGCKAEDLTVYIDNETDVEEGLFVLNGDTFIPVGIELEGGRRLAFVVTENQAGYWLESVFVM